jgi:L-aminopeptidase/D-esterase-like protein
LRELLDVPHPWPLNTTIGVVATSARLTKPEASKMASVAHDGLARAIRPAHALVDGDTIFTLATGQHPLTERDVDAGPLRVAALDRLFAAAADVFATACSHAVVGAAEIGAVPSYGRLCPSAYPTDLRR